MEKFIIISCDAEHGKRTSVELEKKVNKWLSQNSNVNITHMSYNSHLKHDYIYSSVAILYTEKEK